jgi:hypothetical protein
MAPKDAKKPLNDLWQAMLKDDISAAYEACEALQPIINREQDKALRRVMKKDKKGKKK